MRKKIIILFLILLIFQFVQIAAVSFSIRQLQSAVNRVTTTGIGREVAQSTYNLLKQVKDNVVLVAGMNYPAAGLKKLKSSWSAFHHKFNSMYTIAQQLSFEPELLSQLKKNFDFCEQKKNNFHTILLGDAENKNYTAAVHDAAFEFDEVMNEAQKLLGVFLVKFVQAEGQATVDEQRIHDLPIHAASLIGFIIACILIAVGFFALTRIVNPLIKLTHDYEIAMKKLKDEQETTLALEKARASAQAKSDFLANMSHELRTPMNAILGFSQILTETELDKKQKNYLNLILKSGEHLIQIINDILDFSKLESGKIKLEYVDFNLERTINEVMKIVSSKMIENPLDTYVDYPDDLPKNIKSDPTRLKQILVNLLGNAVKFTYQGEVGILVRQDDQTEHTDDEIPLRITVKDSGIGIPKDKVNTIFQSFTQADESTTRQYGGTGLGLTITQSIIATMGGKIWVESTEGQGSEFIFTIKVKKGKETAHRDIDEKAKRFLNGKKVFVIDDNKIACKIIKKNCESLDIDVLSMADSGEAALAKLDALAQKKSFPDVILCDIIMSKMYGYEIAQKIKQNKKFADVKIIAVTAMSEIDAAQYIKKEYFDAYLIKPVSQEDIVSVLSKALGYKGFEEQQQPVVTERGNSLEGTKILVAENVVTNLMLLQECLEHFECDVDYTHNGKEAIEKLESKDYDLCLMDLQMPIMGGVEATEIIRKRGNKKTPIIALTAAVLESDRKKAMDAGMTDFIEKPIDITKLKLKIIQYTSKQQDKDQTPRQEETKIRALVVDDNSLNMKLLVAFLKKLNCEHDGAVNGQEAVDKVKTNDYDICFMDIQMPVMGGVEATKIIREDLAKSFPIIAVTAVKDFTLEKGLAAGMNDCLHKPVDLGMLKKTMSQHLKKTIN